MIKSVFEKIQDEGIPIVLNDEERAWLLCAINHYGKCLFVNPKQDAKEILKKIKLNI